MGVGGGGERRTRCRVRQMEIQIPHDVLPSPFDREGAPLLGYSVVAKAVCLSTGETRAPPPARMHGGRDSTAIWSAAHRRVLVPTDHHLFRYSLANAPLRIHTAGHVRSLQFVCQLPSPAKSSAPSQRVHGGDGS